MQKTNSNRRLRKDDLPQLQRYRTAFVAFIGKVIRVFHAYEKIVALSFTLCGLGYFFMVILNNSPFLFKPYDPTLSEQLYSQSQWKLSQNISPDKVLDEWAITNGFTGWKNYEDETVDQFKIKNLKLKILKDIENKGVSDSFLYSYVGYKYANGTDPTLLNPEHPPLAKYIIGSSIYLFGNEHMIGIGLALVTLLLVAAISYQLYGSLLHASFALLVTSVFPLFTDQIIHGPQLELYQLFFFLEVIHFLLMWVKKKNFLFIAGAGIFFGMLLSTKTVLPFFLLFAVWLMISFWGQWKIIGVVIGLGIITFIGTYYQYFVLGGTLRGLLGVQKYIVIYYGNSHIPLFEFAGNYLRLIFTGSWKFWDSIRTISSYAEWNLLWPIIFIEGMIRLRIRWSTNSYSRMIIVFIVLYNVFVFIVPVFPRYLLLLFVPLIILL
jgi:hypothetical protein